MCFGTAAAGAGPAWNAGTGCAPGLLWKLAAGDGGGDSQRAPGGRSGGGGAQTLAHSQAQDARSLSTRHEGHRWSQLQEGERSGGGSVGRGWRRCRVSRGSGAGWGGVWTGRRSPRQASGRARTRPRAHRARSDAQGGLTVSHGPLASGPGGGLLAPPPRFSAVAPCWLSFGCFLYSCRGRASVRAAGTSPCALPVGSRQVKFRGVPRRVPRGGLHLASCACHF